MKQTPYNTGKVLIGCRFDPPKSNHVTREGEFWQSVLLGDHARARRENVHMVLYVAGLMGVVALIGWLS